VAAEPVLEEGLQATADGELAAPGLGLGSPYEGADFISRG
jgi:hypothetical protein